MVKKILVANRGEIAVRIIRTCHEAGIETVAIFSDVDRSSPHGLLASEAYPVGPAPSTDSYLRSDKILNIAKNSGADAIHPGYGFLSENQRFAQAVIDAGFTWIGPSPESMTQMGDKVAARKIAGEEGVPVVPGSEGPVVGTKQAEKIARSLGYPVLVKAVGGGGGKGMRIVNGPGDLSGAIERATSEAASTFSDERIFLEKYLPNPRHVEIQVVADSHGSVLAMTERDCSIQRRYQKIIEESPSPCVDRDRWEELAGWAKKIATRCDYLGVGTVEFLVDDKSNVYFLEMNTRLQVEHPVTEMITGLDLVREQIRVSSGEKLSVADRELTYRGHSVECRIYAEDGFANFLPSTGTIVGLDTPGGFGVRFDHGIRLGQEITPYYDPLLGKLVTWGQDRRLSVERMKRALRECHIVGVENTVPFCYAVLSHPRFRQGNYNTHFIAEEIDVLKKNSSRERNAHRSIASVITAIHSEETASLPPSNSHHRTSPSRWKTSRRRDALR
ncbi:MAG: acetyl/propionyl/methylcrotonyl-CoA carboxylase subunit alpha [Fidelibacterota bacterium]